MADAVDSDTDAGLEAALEVFILALHSGVMSRVRASPGLPHSLVFFSVDSSRSASQHISLHQCARRRALNCGSGPRAPPIHWRQIPSSFCRPTSTLIVCISTHGVRSLRAWTPCLASPRHGSRLARYLSLDLCLFPCPNAPALLSTTSPGETPDHRFVSPTDCVAFPFNRRSPTPFPRLFMHLYGSNDIRSRL
ncbi:hypothetical protein BDZ89DRAFT_687695 [Hymenopellis radicata]|nr:hypothetical protein BDZ89DRAFT_687695 [Hymenopellis radicata]